MTEQELEGRNAGGAVRGDTARGHPPTPGPPGCTLMKHLSRSPTGSVDFHLAATDVVPPIDAIRREGGHWQPGPVTGSERRSSVQRGLGRPGTARPLLRLGLRGPLSTEWDLASTAFARVPLHARHSVEAEGFTGFGDRSANHCVPVGRARSPMGGCMYSTVYRAYCRSTEDLCTQAAVSVAPA